MDLNTLHFMMRHYLQDVISGLGVKRLVHDNDTQLH